MSLDDLRIEECDGILYGLPGEWTVDDTTDETVCAVCGFPLDASAASPIRATIDHWDGAHRPRRTVDSDAETVWYLHRPPDTKYRVTGPMSELVIDVLVRRWLVQAELPVPTRAAINDVLAWRSTSHDIDFEQLVLAEPAYDLVCEALRSEGLASPEGTDPDWVDSVFFRECRRFALRHGISDYEAIRRMGIKQELGLMIVTGYSNRGTTAEVLNERRQHLARGGEPFSLWDSL